MNLREQLLQPYYESPRAQEQAEADCRPQLLYVGVRFEIQRQGAREKE